MDSKEPAQINLSDDTDPEFQSINFKKPKAPSLKKSFSNEYRSMLWINFIQEFTTVK